MSFGACTPILYPGILARTLGEAQGLSLDALATFPGRLPIRNRMSRSTPRAGVGQYY
jgi:hypothetical protein